MFQCEIHKLYRTHLQQYIILLHILLPFIQSVHILETVDAFDANQAHVLLILCQFCGGLYARG